MTSHTPSPRTVICPGCRGPSIYSAQNPYRPFCSARCKGMDLGAWASEAFAIPAAPAPEGDADMLTPATPRLQ